MDRITSVDVDSVFFMNLYESFLEFHHEGDFGVESAHLTHCVDEVHRVVALKLQHYLHITFYSLDSECFHGLGDVAIIFFLIMRKIP